MIFLLCWAYGKIRRETVVIKNETNAREEQKKETKQDQRSVSANDVDQGETEKQEKVRKDKEKGAANRLSRVYAGSKLGVTAIWALLKCVIFCCMPQLRAESPLRAESSWKITGKGLQLEAKKPVQVTRVQLEAEKPIQITGNLVSSSGGVVLASKQGCIRSRQSCSSLSRNARGAGIGLFIGDVTVSASNNTPSPRASAG
jgi:hypothetical protein